jgi:hypothetical protein
MEYFLWEIADRRVHPRRGLEGTEIIKCIEYL